MKRYLLLTFSVFWMMNTALHANGQTAATSVITGTVTDKDDAAVQQATVILTRPATGQEFRTTTNAQGRYSFYTLESGHYTVLIKAPGFKQVMIDVTTELSRISTAGAKLELGADITATVNISANTESLLQTNSATIGSVFRESTIQRLPVLDRQTNALFFLQPATTESGEFAGARSDQVTITLDGIDVSDKQTGSPSRSVIPVPIESIREMGVAVANASATFLPASGGQVVLVTKSGGNEFHGSGYLYHQNGALAANSWTNNRLNLDRPFLLDNRFGFSAGGPVIKNRTFFFINYEGRRNPDSVTISRIVPTAEFRSGTLRTRNSDNTITALDPAALRLQDPRGLGPNPKMLEYLRLYPLPNDFSKGDGLNTAGYTFIVPSLLSNNIGILRIDHDFNARWNISAKFAADRRLQGCQNFDDQFVPDNCQADLINSTSAYQSTERPRNAMVSVRGTLTSNLVNEARFSWLQDRQLDESASPQLFAGLDIPVLLSNFGSSFGNGALVDTGYRRAVKNDTFQWTDTLSWTKGPHDIQTGLNIRRLRVRQETINWRQNSTPTATIGFVPGLTDLTGILFGTISSLRYNASFDGNLNALPPGAGSTINHRYNEWNFFFLDAWKIRPSLTLTFGLSYGWQSSPVEDTSRESIAVYKNSGRILGFEEYIYLRRIAAETGVGFKPEIEFRSLRQLGRKNAFNTDYSNLSPRFSMAWSPQASTGLLNKIFGDQKTVIRGGYSLVFDRINNATVLGVPELDNGFSTNTFLRPVNSAGQPFRIGTDGPTPTIHTGINIPGPQIQAGALTFRVDPFVKVPRNHTITFSIQRSILKDWMIETGYIGRLGRRLYVDGDLNALPIMHKDMRSGQTVAEAFDAVATALRLNQPVTPQPYFENYFGQGATLLFAYQAGQSQRDSFITGTIRDLFSQYLDYFTISPGLTNFSLASFNTYLYRHSAGYANYHGLFVNLRKIYSRGLTFEFNYSIAKSLDNLPNGVFLTDSGSGGSQGTSLQLQSPFYPDIDYAASGFDIRHIINAYGLYELPFGRIRAGKADSSVITNILKGWFIAGIFTTRSGLPLGVIDPSYLGAGAFGGGNFQFSQSIPTTNSLFNPKVNKGITGGSNGVGSLSNPARGGTGLNLFANPDIVEAGFREILVSKDRRHGRNVLRGLGRWNLDFSIGKETRISERIRFRLSFDFINLFNRVNFADPSLFKRYTFSGSEYRAEDFGVIDTQSNSPRRIQIGGRIEF